MPVSPDSALPAANPPSSGGAADGLVGMMNVFVDPAETARRAPSRLSWLWPVVVLCIVYAIMGYLMKPYSTQLMEAKVAEQSIPADRLERVQAVSRIVSNVMLVLTPVMIVAFIALWSWLIKVIYSIMDVRSRFHDVFSLVAACSLIPMLQFIANYIVLRVKGDTITSAEQLMAPFGLDIFFQGVKGVAFAILNFFSIFQIWYLVVLVIGLAYLTRSSKSKALVAITPAWLIPLLFRMIGAMFSGGG